MTSRRKHKDDSDVTLFSDIINMICVAEGGIMDRDDPQYSDAVNNALYGIIINGKSRLVYDKGTGLNLVPMETL